MIEESYPHIVISDIMMPEMNGLELCKRIKENQNYCHIPVILLTAKSMISQIEEGLDAGADDYIVKPFQISLLKARIRNLLSLREKMKTMYGETFSLKQFGVEEPKEHDDFLTRYIEIVKANISNPELDVSVIYEALGMSRTNFYRKVKTVTGLSPIELIKNIRLEAGAKLLKDALADTKEAGLLAAKAIMTTDTVPKEAAASFEVDGVTVTVGGMSKGSGMIHPNMATMLSVTTTDAKISHDLLQEMVSEIVSDSFNMISVDRDTSTNDTYLVLANGESGVEIKACLLYTSDAADEL